MTLSLWHLSKLRLLQYRQADRSLYKTSYTKCIVREHQSVQSVPLLYNNVPAYDAAGNCSTAAGSGPSVSLKFLTPVPAPAPFAARHLGLYPHGVTCYNMTFFLPDSSPCPAPIQATQQITPGFHPDIIAAVAGSDSGCLWIKSSYSTHSSQMRKGDGPPSFRFRFQAWVGYASTVGVKL